MSEAVDLLPVEERQLEVLGAGLPVTRQDLDAIRERISILKSFVQSQMVQDVDYGTIPGTPKPSLYQPGAQKLARLFGLTVRKERTFQEIEKETNFAMFTYRADVYHARSNQLIAQCEGSCNSQEKKYATRTVKGARENTPIYDILNTLQKMAQKRAMVGAVIEACGASDFFTQDLDSPEEAQAVGVRQTTRAQARVPKAVSAQSTDQTEAETCDCGNPMMISQFGPEPRPWYCGKCKAKRPRE